MENSGLILGRSTKIILVILLMMAVVYFSDEACLIKSFIGIPCPGCGLTRAHLALLKPDINEAFRYHPLFFVPGLLAFYLAGQWKFGWKLKFEGTILTIFAVIFLAVYFIRWGLYFPNVSPMDFNSHAVIPSLWGIVKGLAQN